MKYLFMLMGLWCLFCFLFGKPDTDWVILSVSCMATYHALDAKDDVAVLRDRKKSGL